MKKVIIAFNNFINRLKRKKFKPEDILVLTPHCLRDPACPNDIVQDAKNCKLCGKCQVKDLVELANSYQVKVAVASGGLMAKEKVKKVNPKAVIAIACEKELTEGILSILPRSVYAIINQQPFGPCLKTTFNLDALRKQIERLI